MTLFPYQKTGAAWLASKKYALLADEMRVGKTPQAVVACDLVDARRILVVAPAVARMDWVRKFAAYSPTGREAYPMFSRGAPPVVPAVVTSYSLVTAKDYARDWDVVILDEAHYLKGLDAQRTHEILGKGGIVHRANRVWFLTGTPAPNNCSELWPMLHVCGVYPESYEKFVLDFCKFYQSPYGLKITGNKNSGFLKSLLEPFMLRRTMKEVRPEVPVLLYEDYAVEGGLDCSNFGDDAEAARAAVWSANPGAYLESIAPAVSSLRRHIGMQKVDAVVERVDLLDLPKIVVFAYHRDVIAALAKALGLRRPAVIHGGTPALAREEALDHFWGNKYCKVFIGQITAASTNIDLSVANHCIISEASWVPGENVQAANRLQNVGKLEPSVCEFMSLAGTIDEDIQRVYRKKAADLQEVFG